MSINRNAIIAGMLLAAASAALLYLNSQVEALIDDIDWEVEL